MIRGVGLFGAVEPRSDGFAFVSYPTCLTPAEQTLAEAECARESRIYGLGATQAWVDSRFRGRTACGVLEEFPPCGATTCLSETDMLALAECLSSTPSTDDQRALCDNFAYWSGFPLCSPPAYLPPVPACLTPEQSNLRDYCATHGYYGPTPGLNAYCFLATRQRSWYDAFLAKLPCGAFEYTPPAVTEPPPIVAPPVALPPVEPPVYVPEEPPVVTEPPIVDSRGNMVTVGVIGLLLLAAVGGGGYYAYRRMRR